MSSLRYLNKYLYKYRYRFLLGICMVIISNLFAVYAPQVVRLAIDTAAETFTTYQLFDNNPLQDDYLKLLSKTFLLLGAMFLAIAFFKGLFMFFMRQTLIVMSRYIEYDLKNEVYAHYQKLNLAFYKRNNTGDLMNRISEDVSRVRMYLGPAIMYAINLTVLFILVIVTMFSVNSKLTLFVLLPLPFLSITIYYVSSIINRKSERVQWQLSNLSTFVQEAFSGIRVIKAYNRSAATEKLFYKECESYKNISLDLAKTNALFHPALILLIGLSTILTIYIGGILTIRGEISTGNIAEFVIYVNMLTWPVAALGWVTSLVQRAAASQKRINEFLNTKPEIYNISKEDISIKGMIEFRNVSFEYPDSGIQALVNVSFKIEAGKSLAIIGRTGSGKSTIANLIGRLYDAGSGEILIDGNNIKNISLTTLRSSIGYVPQEDFLFSDTISNNIAYGLPNGNVAQSAIEQAAKDAVVYSNIIEFPKQFNTKVGERGITLSGGQKQRISIARAIIKSPQILIFDDCLSAVDTETEEKIIHNLKRIMKGKTTLIISHRVSSVTHCDHIIVLSEGKTTEYGNHADLIDQKGVYFDLYQKQLLEEDKINS